MTYPRLEGIVFEPIVVVRHSIRLDPLESLRRQLLHLPLRKSRHTVASGTARYRRSDWEGHVGNGAGDGDGGGSGWGEFAFLARLGSGFRW